MFVFLCQVCTSESIHRLKLTLSVDLRETITASKGSELLSLPVSVGLKGWVMNTPQGTVVGAVR